MALDGSYLHDRASQLDATDASMYEVATVSNGLDRGRVYMEEQAILLRHDNNGLNVEIPNAEQSIIVHEQSQLPWVPSPRRLELCSYKDNEAEARVPPLARAEEDFLAPSGSGRKRTARCVARFAASSWMDRRIFAATMHFRSGLESSQGWHNELSSNSDVSDTVGIGRRLRETSTSFEMAVTASHQVTHPKKTVT